MRTVPKFFEGLNFTFRVCHFRFVPHTVIFEKGGIIERICLGGQSPHDIIHIAPNLISCIRSCQNVPHDVIGKLC